MVLDCENVQRSLNVEDEEFGSRDVITAATIWCFFMYLLFSSGLYPCLITSGDHDGAAVFSKCTTTEGRLDTSRCFI